MAIFGDFFASCICSAPYAAHFRPASENRTKTTPCVEVWQTSNLRRLRLGEEKRRYKEETTGQKYNGLLYSIGDHENTMINLNKHTKTKPTLIFKNCSLCVCVSLCTTVIHNTSQNSGNFPSYHPDNHHSSDDIYYRGGGSM